MESIIKKIESLPPLPQTIQKVEELFAKTTAPEIGKLIAIIEKDPLFSAQILAKANSAFYSFRQKITTLQKAVTLLGAIEIKNLLYEILVEKSFDIDLSPYNATPQDLSQTAFIRSQFFQKLAPALSLTNIPAYATLVFLLDVGKVLIAQEIIAMNKTKIFQQDILQFPNESSAEILHANISTLEVDLYLFNKWEFNIQLLQSLRAVIQEKYDDPHARAIAFCYEAFPLVKTKAIEIEKLARKYFIAPELIQSLKHSSKSHA